MNTPKPLMDTPDRVKYPTRATCWNRLHRSVEALEDNGARERTLLDGEAAAQIAILDYMIEDAKFLRKTLRQTAKRDAKADNKITEFRRIEAERRASLGLRPLRSVPSDAP